jgi:hypothetical protein
MRLQMALVSIHVRGSEVHIRLTPGDCMPFGIRAVVCN